MNEVCRQRLHDLVELLDHLGEAARILTLAHGDGLPSASETNALHARALAAVPAEVRAAYRRKLGDAEEYCE
jgi:hypothetical protein